MKKNLLLIFTITTIVVGFCSESLAQKKNKKELNKTKKGTIVGASTGAVIGGMIGNQTKNTALGAILGATVGGAVGAVIGNKMDKKAEKIEEQLGKAAKVERIGEGIKVTFDSKLLFDFGKSYLRAENKETLEKFAKTLNESADTDLLIVGHTDNKGSDNFNENLSIMRAKSVSAYLTNLGITGSRLKSKGKGETQPIINNNNEYNRAQNRRVEIAIFANQKMKDEAKLGI
jgi:outer membrane protein OmpA-like peptidoglycan-associated protein